MIPLRDKIKEINQENNIPVIAGKVTKVDEANMTCTVMPNDDDAEYFEVRLRASIDDKDTGNIMVPKLESQVLISALDNDTDTRFVVSVSEVAKVICRSDKLEFLADLEAGEIIVNGGENGGLINIKSLVDRLNKLENLLNNFISIFNSHTHVTVCGSGSGTASPTPQTQAQTATVTQKSQLEDVTFQH